MLLMEKLQSCEHLSPGQKAVADFMLEHKDTIEEMTIKEIAAAAFTSPATLIRFSKNLGYNGFEQLKHDFLQEQEYMNRHFSSVDANFPFDKNDSFLTIAGKVAALAKEAVDETLSMLSYKDLDAAVKLLAKAGKIYLIAISFPLTYGYDFQLKMRRLGKEVLMENVPGEGLFMEPLLHPDDCALVISYSGETKHPCDMVKICKRHHIPVISLTNRDDNYIRSHSDVSLTIATREKLYSKIAGYSSGFSIKLLLDILYSCYFNTEYQQFLEKKIGYSKRLDAAVKTNSSILREE